MTFCLGSFLRYNLIMEKFNAFEAVETQPSDRLSERIKVTNKVLQKLALWGMVALGPFSATEVAAQNQGVDSSLPNVVEKVTSFENKFKNDGLIEVERRHEKPVIVFTTKENIDANYSEKENPIVSRRSFLSEELTHDFVNGGQFVVVERDSAVLNAIFNEARLGAEGLVKPGEEVKLGNWLSADYYVVSSVEHGEKVLTLKNEIIDMKDGSSVTVSVETKDEHSESSIQELVKKTEKAIEKEHASKNNGQG